MGQRYRGRSPRTSARRAASDATRDERFHDPPEVVQGPVLRPVTEELELAHWDGDTVPIEVTVSGTPGGEVYLVVARDISRRRRHQRTLERLRRRGR